MKENYQVREKLLDHHSQKIDIFGQIYTDYGMDQENPIVTNSSMPSSWVIQMLMREGVDLQDLSDLTGLSPVQLLSPNLTQSIQEVYALFDWSAEYLGQEDLGMRLSRVAEPGNFGVLGYLTRNAPTVRDWCKLLERYHDIFTQAFAYRLHEDEHQSELRYFHLEMPSSDGRHDINFSLGMTIEAIRELLGPDWVPVKCTFTFTAPKEIKPYEAFFGKNLTFNAPYNSMTLDEATLSTRVSDANPELLNILLQQANQLLSEIRNKDDLSHHLELLITASLSETPLDTEAAARQINMSVRNMHRRLNDEGTSFKAIRERAVKKAAREALLETNLPVTQIALKLGFSETSAFVRSFKRMEGITPLQFRKAQSKSP